jgi:hypothetical protein
MARPTKVLLTRLTIAFFVFFVTGMAGIRASNRGMPYAHTIAMFSILIGTIVGFSLFFVRAVDTKAQQRGGEKD